MSKKKAAKLGLTAAVAASAFVAGNPADAAATKADQLVTNAVNAAKQLKPFYGSTSLEVSASFTAKFNAAKAAVAKAKAAKLNDYQSYQVQKAEEEVLRAARYIDAVKVVNNELQPALDELQGYIDDQKIGDEMKAAYDNLSEKIRKAERVIGKVYGAPIREAFLSEFVLPAKIAKETVIYEVSRFNLLNVIDAHIKADELKEAEEKIAMLERLEKRSVEIKEAGNKLHPGKYPELPEIEKALVAKKEAVVKAYEEKLAPAVVSVSAINLEGFKVTFNKAIDASSIDLGDVKIDGNNVALTDLTLSEDGKTLEIKKTLVHGTTYRVTVDGLKTTTDADVTKYENLIEVKDEVAPTVASTSYSYANKTFTINFSEALAAGFAPRVFDKNGSDITSQVAITPALDNKSVTINVAAVNPADNDTFKVVMVGATDVKGNYFANNRVELTFVHKKVDEVNPVVTGITANKDQKSVRVTFSEKVDLSSAVVSVDGVDTNISVVANPANPGEAKQYDKEGKVWDIVVSSTPLNATKNIGIKNAVDAEGNTQASAFNQFVKFEADTVAPKLVSTSVSGTKLVLNFDEELSTPASGTVTVIKPGNIRVSATLTPVLDVKDNKKVTIDLASLVDEAGTYSVELASGMIKDLASQTTSYSTSATFGLAADTKKPTLKDADNDGVVDSDAVVQNPTNPNVFTVKFSEDVSNSALNVSNYLVNGQAIFEKAIFDANKKTVELTAKPNTIDINGATYLFTVSNVADLAGNVMDSKTISLTGLVENVAPVIKEAKLTTASTIQLTYSEAVTGDTATDFEVYVDGQKVNISSYAGGLITLASPVDVDKPIKVKVVDTIEDSNHNVLPKGEVTVTK
jgi:trimeric autotransporter adhesin